MVGPQIDGVVGFECERTPVREQSLQLCKRKQTIYVPINKN